VSLSKVDPRSGHDESARVVRVLVVSPLPPPTGGIASWTKTLSERGIGNGFDLRIVNTAMFGGRTVGRNATLGFSELYRSIRIILALIYSLVVRRPEVVHVNSSLSPVGVFRDAAVSVIIRLFLLNYVVNLRGEFVVPAGSFRGRFTRFAYRVMLGRAAVIVPLTPISENNVRAMVGSASTIRRISNFIDTSQFVENVAPESGNLRVVFVGQLMASKGFDVIRHISKKMSGVTFDLLGPSPSVDIELLRREFTGDDVISDVTLHGDLTRQAVFEILSKSHVLILPSKTEGFPLAVAEGMAAGLAIVGSDVGAIPEMVDAPRGGFVHKPEDVDSYIESLTRLAEDPELRAEMGIRNRKMAASEYDFQTVVAEWRDVYRGITSG
jgi:glycosyltransferase involved in cell wall biosynthesis